MQNSFMRFESLPAFRQGYVRILSTMDRALLKQQVDVPEAGSSVSMLQPNKKPDISYKDIGGLREQRQDIKEFVESSTTYLDRYTEIGINPPRGVLLVSGVSRHFAHCHGLRAIH